MKKNTLRITALAMAAGVTLLSGCGSSALTESQAFYMADSAGSASLHKEYEAENNYNMARSYETAAVPQENMEVAGVMDQQSLTATAPIQPVSADRKLIRTINLTAETTAFDTLLTEVSQTVTALGGYMEQSNISGNSLYDSYSRNRYAHLMVRIPSDKVDSFVSQVSDRANITNTYESTEDVTLQYSDIESRKKSLSIEQERLWELLEKADTMEAIIALEARLSEIRYELESFESQLRTYDNKVDYSTVSLTVNEVPVLTPTAPDSVTVRIQKGFSRNLNDLTKGLVNFFVWLISSLPTLLLLAAILLIIILILRKIKQRTRKLQHEKAIPQPAAIPTTEPGSSSDSHHTGTSEKPE